MRARHARGSQHSCAHALIKVFPFRAVRGGASRGVRRGHAGDVRPPLRGQGTRTWTWTWIRGSGCGVRPGARERTC